MAEPTRRPDTRLRALAIGIAAIAPPTLVQLALAPFLGAHSLILLCVPAIALATWLAGLVAGSTTALAGAIVVAILFVQPAGSAGTAPLTAAADGLLFLAVGLSIVWLSHRARKAEPDLRARERALGALIDSATESMWLVKPDGRVITANAVAIQRIGLSAGDVVGRDWRTLIDPAVAAARNVHFQRVLESGQTVRFEDERAGSLFEHHFTPVSEGGRVTAVATFSRDITKAKRTLDDLRELSQRLTYHVTNSPLAVIEWGQDMRLTRWSGEAERLFGWNADEVLGKRLDEFRWVYEEDADRVSGVSTELRRGIDSRRFSFNRNYRKDGSVVWCEWYNSSLLDESGQFRSILSLVLDVTSRTILEERLRSTAAELAHANQLKDEFLATLSHELRTPLQAIVGWAHILLTGQLNPGRQRHGIETIARNAQMQSQLIDDVLDMSRIITGKLQLSFEPLNIATVIEAAVDTVRPAADARQIALDTRIDSVRVTADAARLQQIVWNLLSNAVKFTPVGGRVSLQASISGAHLEIVVSDTGVGISPEFLTRVFDRFSQADGSTTRRHGGLGLGLAIVRHLVEMHGGTVTAISPGIGHGATFTVRLPARILESRAPSIGTPVQGARTPLTGLRVLVVDDDADAREVTAEALAAAGAAVVPAAAATEAVAAFRRERFDVIVSDLGMPDEDGYGLLARLRTLVPPTELPPAIALTGYGYEADRRRSIEAGFSEHLTKPVHPDTLIASVARVVTAGASVGQDRVDRVEP